MNTPLRNTRLARGESTYKVADAVGVDQSQYSRVESGKRRPSPDLANRIAKYFGNAVTRDQILFPEDYIVADLPPKKTPPARLQRAS
jgi:transcriptional regulator with XRE-family HTH domain